MENVFYRLQQFNIVWNRMFLMKKILSRPTWFQGLCCPFQPILLLHDSLTRMFCPFCDTDTFNQMPQWKLTVFAHQTLVSREDNFCTSQNNSWNVHNLQMHKRLECDLPFPIWEQVPRQKRRYYPNRMLRLQFSLSNYKTHDAK